MAEYIERDAAIQSLQTYRVGQEDSYLEAVLYCARMKIMRLPAADVVPVRHGHWVRNGDWSECSLCGESGTSHIKYCPNCGAKMDGEEKDEKC